MHYAFERPGRRYHVTARGNEQKPIYRTEQFHRRHGDWGRDAALWLGRKVGRLSLCALGKEVGLAYPAVSQAVIRFEKRITKDERCVGA